MSETTTDNCAICGGAQAVFYARQDGYDYVACRDCGFVFLFPMPSAEDLSRIYNEDSDSFGVGRYPKARSRRRRALLRALGLWPYFVGRDVIDVGCGGGFMVDAMRRLGARASGLDIGAGAIAHARDAFPRGHFYAETFEAFLRRGLQFDFIHSSEVIEHIGDPRGYMAFLAGVARPGARVFLTTPDIAHAAVPEDVTDWDMVAPPRHVQFFTEATLTRLFDDFGFDIVKRYAKKHAPTLQVLARKRG
jgi:2-polyprenyl-3-methyl-5-hydroxy-6-metoxy-1,4-benzoquinol methylase